MPLSQTGATYANQSELARRDKILGEGLDDLASQIQAVRSQGNYGQKGAVGPPSSPTALQVTSAGGIFTATVVHNSPPVGTQYVLQYSTTPNFQSPISELLTHTPTITTTWQKSLPSQKLYFRVAPKFPASPLGSWVYAGTSAAPSLIG